MTGNRFRYSRRLTAWRKEFFGHRIHSRNLSRMRLLKPENGCWNCAKSKMNIDHSARKPEAAGRAHATKEREGGKAAQGNPGGKNGIDTL